MHKPQEQRSIQPTSSGNVNRRQTNNYDDVLNTRRLKNLRSNLRPTILATKQQPDTEGKSLTAELRCIEGNPNHIWLWSFRLADKS